MFGNVLFNALLIFPFVYIIGYSLERLVFRQDLGRTGNMVVNLVFFVGVFVHEASHRIMDILVGVPSHNFRVKYRDENSSRASPHGSVTPKQPYQMTLLQGFLGSFAPLLFGAWIIYYLLLVAFSPIFDPVIRIIAGICTVSVFLTLSPSKGDLFFLKFSFQNDPTHGLYQLFLVALSFLFTWVVVGVYNILLPVEFLYYFIIVFFYVVFKYSFILMRIIYRKITPYDKVPHSARAFRKMAHRRYKPQKY